MYLTLNKILNSSSMDELIQKQKAELEFSKHCICNHACNYFLLLF